MKKIIPFLMCLFISNSAFSQDDASVFDEAAYQHLVDSIDASFTYQIGEVDIQGGLAILNVPTGYKFLDAEQSNYVLTELWGNPPSEVLGLLFPENESPLSESMTFAVEVSYSADGYIEDDDAQDIDYDDLLAEMQGEVVAENEYRVEAGYEPIVLVGWASAPFYDQAQKKLHWAKEIKFGDSEINTLNYNIRILGRKGYLNLNAIGDITALPVFERDIDTILNSVDFAEGNTYADFDPEFDEVAAYGIGGLIAGKLLAKAGFFALILKFWKIIAVAVAGGFSAFKKFFSKKEEVA